MVECRLWWPSLTKDMQTEQLLCWSGMTDTEHTVTSSSNEDVIRDLYFCVIKSFKICFHASYDFKPNSEQQVLVLGSS